MATPERLALLWGGSFFAGSLAQLVARLSGIPVVVLLLASGLLVGEAGLGLIHPSLLGQGLEPLVGLLVCLVLFDGGLNLRLASRTLQRSLLQLVLVRSLLGFAGGALLAHWLAGLSWPLALVYGAIALATGPTVVTPLVRQMRLSPDLARLLEAEGLILEPVGAVLALLLLQLALGDLQRWQDVALSLLLRVGGGALIGGATGLLLSLLLQRLGSSPEPAPAADAGDGLPPRLPGIDAVAGSTLPLQITLGMLFLLFGGCEALLPESGLPAAVCAGVVVGLRLEGTASLLDALIAQLALLAITVLFPLLAADVSWGELLLLGGGGVLCVLALTPARWLVLQIAGLGLPFSAAEKLMLTWIAPRGIVTAAVASLFALQLDQAGVEGGPALKGLVFLTILLTVGLQGVSAPWLARRLGLCDGPAEESAPAASS
ncbi:MAG: cation:proton antiporter [Synechococcus sp. ELA057]